MKRFVLFSLLIAIGVFFIMNANASETLATSAGEVNITHLGHGSVRMKVGTKVIHVDPYSEVADYSKQPKADLILITHDHFDHLDAKALKGIITTSTEIIAAPFEAKKLGSANKIVTLANGQSTTWNSITIEAVPAYNVKHMKPDNTPFHPKGYGNGYVVTVGDKKIYFAGDTEDIDEMAALKGKIDIAFLPKNLPYTMDDEMFIKAAKSFAPKVLHPYHYSEVKLDDLRKKLAGTGIDLQQLPVEK